jgi:NAD(P)H-flavin reductase
MKSLYSPLALVFKCSHEHLNPWHRLVGRIIYSLLMLHATWYMNFFIQAGIFPKRLFDTIVIIGMVAFCLTTLMVTTSLERVRRWSYRVFFIIHLFIGMGLMPLLFFHAKPLRLYVSEALVLFIFDVTMRKLDTVTGFATITPVPKTKLVKLKIPVPASKMHRFHAAPGQHVYLNIPAESRPSKTAFIHELLYNPFTVAGVSTTDVTLVLRALDGPTTKQVHNLTRLQKAKPPISIEGPLGSSRNFPNLAANYDRILLVAGGVGASFILPIYRHLRGQLDAEARSRDRLTFTWSMRSAAEASWTLPSSPDSETTLSEDSNIKIFITRSNADDRRHSEEILPQDGSVELDELQAGEEPVKATGGRDRPDLRSIVDESFRAGGEERVAVLVCGPKGMAREVRESVGRWVEKGREVWFHDESFGW